MFVMRSLVLTAVLGIAATVSSAAFAADRTVTVVNKTKTTMSAIYASSVGARTWEEDILGEDMLEPGESVDIDMDDGSGACRFDLKAEFSDGSNTIQQNLNVCKVGEFTFTE
ncbi:hypothetical protein H0A65_11735 [Alcaligenaceae bacterium]|nr:hypothetical protein [Alcaligenaceae bacterium]